MEIGLLNEEKRMVYDKDQSRGGVWTMFSHHCLLCNCFTYTYLKESLDPFLHLFLQHIRLRVYLILKFLLFVNWKTDQI